MEREGGERGEREKREKRGERGKAGGRRGEGRTGKEKIGEVVGDGRGRKRIGCCDSY